MKSIHDELDDLFRGAPPPLDETGALRALLHDTARAGAIAVFAADGRGALLSLAPDDDEPLLAVVRAAAERLARLRSGRSSATLCVRGNRRNRCVGVVRLPGAPDRAGFIGVVHRAPLPASLARIIRSAAFRRRAVLAHTAASLVQERNLDRARARQLEAEQAALRTAHAETVTAVLLEREEHAQARRRYIDELETEVQRRSADLREALARAEQASESKSQFLANMSHEIRTPMTAILGFAESLADAGLSDDERKAAIDTILRNGKHLLEIINDILDLSKIEAGRLDAEDVECRLPGLVTDVLDLMRVKAEAKNLPLQVSFNGPCPTVIRTDPTRLRQILINLIGNAIKFTSTGHVRLEIRYQPPEEASKDAGRVVFDVIDTGIGIHSGQFERLFTPFSQADNSMTRRFGGTGLGLAISLRLARMLGGGIEVQSQPGVGSRFRLHIATRAHSSLGSISLEMDSSASPAQDSTARAQQKEPVASGLALALLLAEDGPDNQRLISFVLRRAGHEVTIVDNGRAACEATLAAAAAGRSFDVVLMDMQMPEWDGYTATRELRARGYRGPIVALTAHAMTGDRERCLEAGCDEYATKPIDRAKLLKLIEEIARRPQDARG